MPYSDLIRVYIEPVEDARLVRVSGEIDMSTAPRVREVLDAARADGVTVLLDLADVAFIDARGLRLLLEASATAALEGWAFFIVRPSEAVQRLVALTGTGPSLPVVEPAEPAAA